MHNNFNADEKILRYTNKLDYFFNGHKTLIIAELDLTNKCNNSCPECCGIKETSAELNKEQIDKIINSLVEIDCKGVILSGGGEPLVSPFFLYAVEQLGLHGIKIGLNSNGLALDAEKINAVLKYCEYFRISLDAADAEMYKKTHGMSANSFESVVQNCKNFVKIKKETGSGTSFVIGFLTGKDTISQMEDFILLCKDIGADCAQFRPYIGDFSDVSEMFSDLKKRYETQTFFIKASLQKYREMGKEQIRPYSKCSGMFFSTVITADAKVYACLHYRQNPDYYLGDLNKQTMSEIFRSDRIKSVYEKIDCSKCPPFCRNDVFNRTLNNLSNNVTHQEFL